MDYTASAGITMPPVVYTEAKSIERGADYLALKKFGTVFTGDRKKDRKAIIEAMGLVGILNIDIALSLREGLRSDNPGVCAVALRDVSRILGSDAPEQVEVSANPCESMTHDELVVSLLRDLVLRGVIGDGVLSTYMAKISGKIRFGGMLVAPGELDAPEAAPEA